MRIIAILGIAALTFVATLLTTCIERPVYSRDDMAAHRLGYPLQFVRQDIRRYDPGSFPEKFRFDPPWESPTIDFYVETFLASWFVIFHSALVLTFGPAFAFRWARNRRQRPM